jgi:hypothetical protein
VDFLLFDMRANPILRELVRQQMRDAAAARNVQALSLGIVSSSGAGDGFLMNRMGGFAKCKAMSRDVLLAQMAEEREKRAAHKSIFSKVAAHILGMCV